MVRAIGFHLLLGDGLFDEVGPPLRLEKRVPGADTPLAGPLAGVWVDVVDREGVISYSKILDRRPDGTREVFTEATPTTHREPDPNSVNPYLVYVPDEASPGERELVVFRTDPTAASPVAIELGRIPF
jgi:hypothetical protein